MEKKIYVITFVYSLNRETYRSVATLSEAEKTRINTFLEGLEAHSEIKLPDEASEFISNYEEPEPCTFNQLKSSWTKGNLVNMGKWVGVRL